MISSWIIVLAGATIQWCSEQRCSFLAANLAWLCKILEKSISRDWWALGYKTNNLLKVSSLAYIKFCLKMQKIEKGRPERQEERKVSSC